MVSTITLYVTGPYHITKVFARYKAVRHIKIVHENAKPFTCLICHQTFGLNVNLKTHVKIVHDIKCQAIQLFALQPII